MGAADVRGDAYVAMGGLVQIPVLQVGPAMHAGLSRPELTGAIDESTQRSGGHVTNLQVIHWGVLIA